MDAVLEVGGDIQWHTGTIRVGPGYKSHRTHDDWVIRVSIERDRYDLSLCHLAELGGSSKKMTAAVYRHVLRVAYLAGFKRAQQTRKKPNGTFVKQECDLTKGRFHWVDIEVLP